MDIFEEQLLKNFNKARLNLLQFKSCFCEQELEMGKIKMCPMCYFDRGECMVDKMFEQFDLAEAELLEN